MDWSFDVPVFWRPKNWMFRVDLFNESLNRSGCGRCLQQPASQHEVRVVFKEVGDSVYMFDIGYAEVVVS
jgi:hypothetical protein